MDSVIGTKGGKTLLTIFFTNCDLQLMYLREDNTAAGVTEDQNSQTRQRWKLIQKQERPSSGCFIVALCKQIRKVNVNEIMNGLEQSDIAKMMNHINSYQRKKWNGQAPIDMFINIYGKDIATLLGLEKIEPASIYLRPDLLK